MGKPFFSIELRTNQKLIDNLTQLPARAKRNVLRLIRTDLIPALEERANSLAQDMPMPSSPFAFGTPKSRRYYFWMIRNNPSLSDGEHWIRTFAIESGFQFTASDGVRSVQIRGRNAYPQARYVFGPWAVQGHINTGWPERGEEIRAELQAFMRRELARMWRDSVREALKGQG